jgi:hypothetical protein
LPYGDIPRLSADLTGDCALILAYDGRYIGSMPLQYQYTVDMVGHHNAFIDPGIGKMRPDIPKAAQGDLAENSRLVYGAEDLPAPVTADGHEIIVRGTVVVAFEPRDLSVRISALFFHVDPFCDHRTYR